ncbi:MAG: hypothetical protein ACRDTG_14215 [Pseudonocardiaceae bacterium]
MDQAPGVFVSVDGPCGVGNRPDISAQETALHLDAPYALTSAGVPVLRLETDLHPPDTLAALIHLRIEALRASRCPTESQSQELAP